MSKKKHPGAGRISKPQNKVEDERITEHSDSPREIESRVTVDHPVEEEFLARDSSDLFGGDLLDRARTLWQVGDWGNLRRLDRSELANHPERAKLALLAAAGHQQANDLNETREYVRQAREWGAGARLVCQVMLAGLQNSLGRARAMSGHQERAREHFEQSVRTVAPGTDSRHLIRIRVEEQFDQLRTIGIAPESDADEVETSWLPSLSLGGDIDALVKEIALQVRAEISSEAPSPYGHNRLLGSAHRTALFDFAATVLGLDDLRPAYLDYLAGRALQIERNCEGRLATTVQDAVARQLVLDCLKEDDLCVLEIGTLYGVSPAILYNHAVTRFDRVELIGLDPFDGFYGEAIDALLNQPVTAKTFVRNMRLADVPDDDFSLIMQYSTSPLALEQAKQFDFNLLVIDGDHSYEGIKFDFDNYFPLLRPGGYVIFDDYNAPEWPGVQSFIDRDVQSTPEFEWLGFVSRTAVGRKRAE